MHSHTPTRPLPALRRQQPLSNLSHISPTPSTENIQASMTPTAEGRMGYGGSSPSAVTAASHQKYGQPWNTPSTLNTLATVVTYHSREANATHLEKREHNGSHFGVCASQSLPRSTVRAYETVSNPLSHVQVGCENAQTTAAASPQVLDTDTLALQPSPRSSTASARAERLSELEDFIQANGGRRSSITERHKVYHKTLTLVSHLYPPLSKVMESIRRYLDDISAELRRGAEEKARSLQEQEKTLYARFEAFFEGKIRELILAKEEAEARARSEHSNAFALREERDKELMAVKADLIQSMHSCEKTEDQFRDFRHLISSVFQTNQQLKSRVEALEEALLSRGIEPPPASAEVIGLTSSSEKQGSPGNVDVYGNGDGYDDGGDISEDRGDGKRRGRREEWYNNGAKFMAAAKQELIKSRLTLQEELLHSAFNDRSAYRMRIEGLSQKNLELTFNVSELEGKIQGLYTYIHEKRFAPQVDEAGNEIVAMTPRPRHVPLALQTELGVDLRRSTADIISELSALAINMKHQLTAALLITRQLQRLSTWLADGNSAEASNGGVTGMLDRVSATTLIHLFPANSWPSIPHFLRTSVETDVFNYFWTETQIACILHNFFKSYKRIRQRARFVRDSKMLKPRVYQLFEHSQVILTRVDASKEEVAEDEENVPFGYVVTQFARDVLSNLSAKAGSEPLSLILAGTVTVSFTKNTLHWSQGIHGHGGDGGGADGSDKASHLEESRLRKKEASGSRLSVDDCPWQDPPPIVEMELISFTYNLWYSAVRYQRTQPLCHLFLKLVDGQMPQETFDMMEKVIGRLQRRVELAENDRARRFPYSRLVKGIVRSVDDIGSSASIQAVQAVVQAFEMNGMPLYGGYLGPVALFADETYCRREIPGNPSEDSRHYQVGHVEAKAPKDAEETPPSWSLVTNVVPLPTSCVAHTPPSLVAPLGATCIVHFCRRLVHDVIEKLYRRIECALFPLVEESELVLGLYLISIPRSRVALAELFDASARKEAFDLLSSSGTTYDGDSSGGVTIPGLSVDAMEGARLTAESAQLLGVRSLTHSYITMLGSRIASLEEKLSHEHSAVSEMLDNASQRLPHFKSSTHFPFQAQAAAQTKESGDSEGSEPFPSKDTSQRRSTSAVKPASGTLKKGGRQTEKEEIKQKISKRRGDRDVKSARENRSDKPRTSSIAPRTSIRKSVDGKYASRENNKSGPPNSDKPSHNLATNALVQNAEDGDLVEWYSLRHVLRSTMPSLPWSIFQPEDLEGKEVCPSSSAVSEGTNPPLPTLRAEEVSAPS